MFGGYEGGWAPQTYFTSDIPTETYHNKSGKPYMDIRAWAAERVQNEADRNKMLKNIYMSAKMMKFHPEITKDMRKTYSMLASAAMRAMSKEYKWNLKKKLAPYNEARKLMAVNIAAAKARNGYAPRKGLAGRIAYWNKLQSVPIGAKDAWDMLYGFDPENPTLSSYKVMPKDSLYKAANYEAYKAALTARAEARKAERAKLSPAEYDAYRRRARLLAAARKELSAQRKARHEELKTTGDIHWGPYTAYDYREPMEEAVDALIASTPDYRGIDKADIMETLMAKDHPSFFNDYTGKIEGWADRGAYVAPKYRGISYTGRQAVDYDSAYQDREAAAIGATPYVRPMQTEGPSSSSSSGAPAASYPPQ